MSKRFQSLAPVAAALIGCAAPSSSVRLDGREVDPVVLEPALLECQEQLARDDAEPLDERVPGSDPDVVQATIDSIGGIYRIGLRNRDLRACMYEKGYGWD